MNVMVSLIVAGVILMVLKLTNYAGVNKQGWIDQVCIAWVIVTLGWLCWMSIITAALILSIK